MEDRNGVDPHEDVAAYALDALADGDRVRFEAHLESCVSCQDEVSDLQAATTELSAGLEVEPPPELRARVLAAVAEEEQTRPGPGSRTEPEADAPLDLSRAREARGRRGRAWWPVAAAAAAVLAVGGTFLFWPEDPAAQVIEASDAQVFSTSVDGATIEVFWSGSENEAAMRATDLPQAPEGRDMQVWAIGEDGAPRSLGLVPRSDDEQIAMVLGGLSPADADLVGITLEPEGGSQQPTTEPMALIDLDA